MKDWKISFCEALVKRSSKDMKIMPTHGEFLDALLKLGQGPVTVQDENDEVIFEEEDEETEIIINDFLWFRGCTKEEREEEWGFSDEHPQKSNSPERSERDEEEEQVNAECSVCLSSLTGCCVPGSKHRHRLTV